jgi:hypothetical protein
VACCTSQCSEVTTIIDMSVGSVVTPTEKGLREGGMFKSLSGCWAHSGVPTSGGDGIGMWKL